MKLYKGVNGKNLKSIRETIDLSGEWEFQMDPHDVGKTERWYEETAPFDRKIHVPGAWNAQGMGYEDESLLRAYEKHNLNAEELSPELRAMILEVDRESEKLYHVFPGPAWYRRTVTIPPGWKGKICWLKFDGVHRYADVWVNGQFAGAHLSYLTSFQFDLCRWVKPGEKAVITVRVDARRNKAIDPLMGCMDTADFLYITWGGIHGNVMLEATAPEWIEDLFVVPQVSNQAVELRLTTAGNSTKELQVVVEVLDSDGIAVAEVKATIAAKTTETIISVPLPEARLWSPTHPHLYTVRIALMENGVALDSCSTRFGMRELKVENGEFLLNGRPIFLRGYGDDCIFPQTIAPPSDREEYRRRLSIARDYGFNYVRHHSWFPPEEYFDVADELGMMVQPELPISYAWFLPTTPEQKQFMTVEWEAAIRRYRNHPSIVTWCMGNELYKSFDFAPQLYRRAKEADPTRLVIDSDGFGFNNDQDRDTLDFWVNQFAESTSCGFQDEAKYQLPPNLKKAVIAHEMGYFVTLPNLTQLDLFGKGLRPYWLTQTHALAQKNGIRDAYPHWVELSERLQAICLKSNFEAARRSNLSGYSHWLFQDYPNCAEGVVDMFFRPKGLTPAEFQKFNAPTVLLLDAPRRNYYFGETADLHLLASRYEDDSSERATLRWELRAGAEILASGKKEELVVASNGLQTLMPLQLVMPYRSQAEKLTLAVELADGSRTIVNDWNFWVFPKKPNEETPKKIMIGEPRVLHKLYPSASDESAGAISPDVELLMTSHFREETLDYLAKGGRVILFAPDKIFSTEPTHYRLAAWDGGGSSGTEIEREHPAFRDMPNDGWGDLQFFSLIQGSKSILLDSLPAKIRPWFALLTGRNDFQTGRIFLKFPSAKENFSSAASILNRGSKAKILQQHTSCPALSITPSNRNLPRLKLYRLIFSATKWRNEKVTVSMVTANNRHGLHMTFQVHQTIPENERKILFEWSPNIFGGPDYHLQGRSTDIHIVGYVDGQPVAHVGLLKQQVLVGSIQVLVSGVGGVVTIPQSQNLGYSKECLKEAGVYMRQALGVNFGFLFCQDRLVKFYESAGWRRIDDIVFINQPTGKVKVPYCSMIFEFDEAWPKGQVDVDSFPW